MARRLSERLSLAAAATIVFRRRALTRQLSSTTALQLCSVQLRCFLVSYMSLANRAQSRTPIEFTGAPGCPRTLTSLTTTLRDREHQLSDYHGYHARRRNDGTSYALCTDGNRR